MCGWEEEGLWWVGFLSLSGLLGSLEEDILCVFEERCAALNGLRCRVLVDRQVWTVNGYDDRDSRFLERMQSIVRCLSQEQIG